MNRPLDYMRSRADVVLIVTASCDILFCKKEKERRYRSTRRLLSVALNDDNIANVALTVFKHMSNMLTILEEKRVQPSNSKDSERWKLSRGLGKS